MRRETTASEISQAVAVRRRERLLQDASGSLSCDSWWVPLVAVNSYLVLSPSTVVPAGTTGLFGLLCTVGGWQYFRLNARINALTRLLSDVSNSCDEERA